MNIVDESCGKCNYIQIVCGGGNCLNTKKCYHEYGDEWVKEILKMRKIDIINMLRDSLIKNKYL